MKIDFLSIVASSETAAAVLALPNWLPCSPLKGYRAAFQHESGMIYAYDPYGFAEASPVLIKSSGDSVAALLPFVGDQDKVTRLDFAYDSNELRMSDIHRVQHAGNVVSMVEYRTAIHGPSGEVETMYWGRRDGTCLIRAYDKAKEQKVDTAETWTRIEYELHGETARLAWDLYKCDKSDCASFLASRWRVVRDGETPARKRPLAAWFIDLISGCVKRFRPVRKKSTLESKLEFARKALNSVRLLIEVEGAIDVVSKLLSSPLTLEQNRCLSLENYQQSKTRPILKSLRRAERSSCRKRLRSLFLPGMVAKTFSNALSPAMCAT